MVIDLTEVGTDHPGFKLEGSSPNIFSGFSVAGAGDVNGDGFADVIVGIPWTPTGFAEDRGEAVVVFGKADGDTVPLGNVGDAGFRILGASDKSMAGYSVSGAGDVNGDGFADVVVGAPSDVANPSTGEAQVILGRSGTGSVDMADLGTNGFRILGNHVPGLAGECVAGAGDVNGDGLGDVLVTVPGTGFYGGDLEAYVVFGKAGGELMQLGSDGWDGLRIACNNVDPLGGRSVSGAGDMNGDGLADFLVGGTFAVFGDPRGRTTIDTADLGIGGFRVSGHQVHDGLGASLSGVGDVNGDGIPDIVVGAAGSSVAQNANVGVSFVVFGKSDNTTVNTANLGPGGFMIEGIDAFDNSGESISGAGDVNGDGLADLIVGALGAQSGGEAYVVLGKADSTTVDLSNLGSGGFRMDGADNDKAGDSVSGAGDVNGDGLADLIVGASWSSVGINFAAGRAYVVFSPFAPPGLPTYKATARAGNAPPVAVGIIGDGSDDDSPSSRCWIDFDGGQGPGLAGSSMQTVTLVRNDAGIRALNPARLANVQWRVQTDRSGWKKTRVTLKYTDAEIAGLREETLRVWRAASPRGPWALYSSGMVREPQRNRISVNVPALGYFAIEGEPAP